MLHSIGSTDSLWILKIFETHLSENVMGVFARELKVEKVRENNKMESTNNMIMNLCSRLKFKGILEYTLSLNYWDTR
jgi:hypothetical protein